MGGKNEIINLAGMNNLFINGSAYIDSIKESINNLEQILAELREMNLVGEKGLVCRQAVNAISALTNDLSRTTEKVAVFMEVKIHKKQTSDQNQQILLKQKDNYSKIKR